MAIYQTATYQVKKTGTSKVKAAIKEFVRYIQANEPGTQMYLAWQQQDDPTKFIHLFIFENEAAQTRTANPQRSSASRLPFDRSSWEER